MKADQIARRTLDALLHPESDLERADQQQQALYATLRRLIDLHTGPDAPEPRQDRPPMTGNRLKVWELMERHAAAWRSQNES